MQFLIESGIIDVLLPALLALFGAALAYATVWLRTKASDIKNDTLRTVAFDTITRAKDEISASVKYVAQTYVDDLKAANEDGKLTDDEEREARNRAIATFKQRMTAHGLEQLAAIVGDVHEWIVSEIEGAVWDLGKESSNEAA